MVPEYNQRKIWHGLSTQASTEMATINKILVGTKHTVICKFKKEIKVLVERPVFTLPQ